MGLSPIIPDPGEEEEKVKRPKLQTVPVLPEDYPLFDWDWWPRSYAALAPGIPTTRFEKDCWNNIVDTLAAAMEEAGLDFYRSDEGFSPEDIHITGGRYGVLTAEKMNDLIWAMDDLYPFEWPWINDYKHPGAVNHWDFRDHGFFGKRTNNKEKANVLYAQYILDVVDRLNLLIQLMRDNYPYHNNVKAKLVSESIRSVGLRRGVAGVISRKMLIPLLVSSKLRSGKGVPQTVQHISHLQGDFRPELLHAAPLQIPLISMRYQFDVEIRRPAPARLALPGVILRTNPVVALDPTRPVDCSFAFLLHSASDAQSDQILAVATSAALRSLSRSQTELQQGLITESEATVISTSGSQAEVISRGSRTFAAVDLSKSRGTASFGMLKTVETKASLLLRDTRSETTLGTGKGTGLEALPHMGASDVVMELLTEPSAPVEVCSDSTTAGSVEILKPRHRPMWSELRSVSKVLLEPEALPEQVVAAERITRTGAQVLIGPAPPAGITAAGRSITAFRAALDTAWLPPVWVDGGLWIRQAHTIVKRDDGSLEVH